MTKCVLAFLLVTAVAAVVGHAWAGTRWITAVLVGAGLSRDRNRDRGPR